MKFITFLILLVPAMALSDTKDKVDRVCKRMKYEDCTLIKAIITVESSFNPLSVGHDGNGSLGLMQIKCSTARTLDNINGRKPIECQKLFISEVNVAYGIEYLRHLHDLLTVKPNKYELLSAYNGGYLFHRLTNSYRVKLCNAVSFKKKRKCVKGQPFNIEYSKRVMAVYKKIIGE